MHGLSAAHRALPLGSVVRVRHLENGRTVTVRVNDRGPFIRGRIIDLSLGAARALDMEREGVAKVEVRLVESPTDDVARPFDERSRRFVIQVGSFADRDNALGLKLRLADEHPDVRIVRHRGVHRVRLGDFVRKRDAEGLRRALRNRGFDALIVAETLDEASRSDGP